jgi:glycine dehydrogenase
MIESGSLNSSICLNGDDRENSKHYIPLTEDEERMMLQSLGQDDLKALFDHISTEFLHEDELDLEEALDKEPLQDALSQLSSRNSILTSFIGDGLPDYETHKVVKDVLGVRKLATSYTPYQPERSQGTLISQWIYQCGMATLTGFEAINASMYDRSTALFEACTTAVRASRGKSRVLIASNIYPGDKEVIETHFADTQLHFEWIPTIPETGMLDIKFLSEQLEKFGKETAAVAFPQVNTLGNIENVDEITDLIASFGSISIGIIDPMHLVSGGLKPPSQWGAMGSDMLVGEAQHLALNPCFGGPGLGVFGVRTDAKRKNLVRYTPGRYVGKANDVEGRDCFVAVMSAREQHIRKDKATSNICSNQAYIAALAGAALLAYGDEGMRNKLIRARKNAEVGKNLILRDSRFSIAHPDNPYLNEITFEVEGSVDELLDSLAEKGVLLGVDVTGRIAGDSRNLLKVSFHDRDYDWSALSHSLNIEGAPGIESDLPELPVAFRRSEDVGLMHVEYESLVSFYKRLGDLNVSPDDGLFPLGSCTMKYNPKMNEWAAGLEGFQYTHPQAPISSVQGNMEVLYHIQNIFKKVTGLPGVTTQPVAGAQGELVGLKLFQAYHKNNGQSERDIVFIPQTAHGTNFATAVVAGYSAGRNGNNDAGVIVLKTDPVGGIDLQDFHEKLDLYGNRLVGIMITNPNTCGVFEENFKAIADKVHEAGGLVYMDGANMNAIAGRVDLDKIGVDAVHNNIHKTWSIPHGGGGPGDGFVAVSSRLLDYLPGYVIEKQGDQFVPVKPEKSIGSFHRHWGNFNHKIRCITYLLALGRDGIKRMSAVSVLSARYLLNQLTEAFDELPIGSLQTPRMHEFVLTFKKNIWDLAERHGIAKTAVMPGLGKVFLDFGYHAPTVAFPEPFGIMIEPTESYSKAELDRFVSVAKRIVALIEEKPEVLKGSPVFHPQ